MHAAKGRTVMQSESRAEVDIGGHVGPSRRLGRYVLHEPIATGGMASVHFGRALGPVGFARAVAIKRLHPHLAHDPEFVTMFLDEARLAARVLHPNVVSTLDVVSTKGEVFVVMEYVRGEALSRLFGSARAVGIQVPPAVVASIAVGVLHGLHAAHEAKTEQGEPLSIVHRDVSPQNILVGDDGLARIADFGVAKAAWRFQCTREGQIKGKLSYMSPEQAGRDPVDRRADIYAMGIVLWEGLTGRRLFEGDSPASILASILSMEVEPPSRIVPSIPAALDRVVARALSRDPAARFATALEMTTAIESALRPASQGVVAHWVRGRARDALEWRATRLVAIEASPIMDEGESPLPDSRTLAIHRTSNVPTVSLVLPVSSELGDRRAAWTSPAATTDQQSTRRPRSAGAASFAGLTTLAILSIIVVALTMTHRAPARVPLAPTASAVPSATASDSGRTERPAPSAVALAQPRVGSTQSNSSVPDAGTSRSAAFKRTVRSKVLTLRASCNPPYTLDPSSKSPDGQPLKRFKRWCL
jgi:serine/threonine-protein kinase